MTPIFIWSTVIALGIIFTLGDTNLFNVLGTGPDNIGQVDGHSISVEQYQNLIQSYTQYYRNQREVIDDETQAQLENEAWNSIINQHIVDDLLKNIGIEVTNEEIIATIESSNPPEIIQQYFRDSSGVFRPEYVQQAILEPRYNDFWVYIENTLRQQELERKFNLFLKSSFVSSSLELKKEMKWRQNSYNIHYIRVPYSEISDSLIQVSEQEIIETYENEKSQFNQEKRYLFDYVYFRITPRRSDTVNTLNDFRTFYRPEFENSTNDSLFFDNNQPIAPYSLKTVNSKDIRDEYREVLSLEDNEVSKVIVIDQTFHLLKKISSNDSTVTFLDFSRRLDIDETIDHQLRMADDFYIYSQEDGFDEEAERRELTVYQGTVTGDNPFITSFGGNSFQITNFLDAANEGDISPPYRISDQIVVLRLYDIQSKRIRPLNEVRQIVEGMTKNKKRKNLLIERLNRYAQSNTLNDWSHHLGRSIDSLSVSLVQNYQISGIGRDPYLLGWLESMKEGETSPVIQGDLAAYIIHLDKISVVSSDQEEDKERKKILEERVIQSKYQLFISDWLDIIRSQADITDNRRYFIQ